MVEIRQPRVPADAATERRLRERALVVYEQFPEVAFRVQVLNRRHAEKSDARSLVPASAVEIPLPERARSAVPELRRGQAAYLRLRPLSENTRYTCRFPPTAAEVQDALDVDREAVRAAVVTALGDLV